MKMLKKIIQKFFGILLWPLKKYWALWGKKKWLFILITLVILWWVYFSYTKFFASSWGKDDLAKFDYPPAEEITLATGDIVSAVKMVGTSKLENEQTLKFAKAGKIRGIFVKAGMKVKQGQLLASLDMSEVESRIQKARSAYDKANRDLKDLLDGKDKTDVLSAEYSVERAKIALDDAKDTFAHSKEIKKNELAKNQIDLEIEKKKYFIEKEKFNSEVEICKESLLTGKVDLDNIQKDRIQKFDKELRDIESKYYSLKDSLDGMDEYLWVKNNLVGDAVKNSIYFSAKNTSYKTESKSYLGKTYSLLEDLKKQIDELKKDKEDSKDNFDYDMKKMIPLYTTLKEYYDASYNLWKNYQLAAKNSVDSVEFSESTISSLESMWESAKSAWTAGIDAMQEKIKNLQFEVSLKNVKLSKKNQYLGIVLDCEEKKAKFAENELKYKNAIYEIEQKEKKLTRDIKEKELSMKEAENSLEKAKEDYKKIKKWYTEDQLQNAKDLLESQKKELEAAQKERDSYHITATFDGTVRKVDMQVGDNLVESNDKSIVLENRDMIKIEMQADQSDILKLKLWQNTIIKFDAFPDKQFKWKIIEVDETPQKTEGVVKYKVVASLTDLQGAKIFSDMSAMVNVLVSEKIGINVVPVLAVGNDEQGSYVLKFADDSKIYVTVWVQDGDNIEILSGLDMATKIKSTTFNAGAISEMGLDKKKDDMGMMWWWSDEYEGGDYEWGF